MSVLQVISSPAAIAPVGSGTPPAAQPTFAEWLAGTASGAGPTRYWPMSDASGGTMTATVGGINGTYTNTSNLEFEVTDAASVKHIGFGGVSGHVVITTPITTGAFTLMARLQFDAAPAQMIIASTDYGNTPGQFLISVIDDSASGLKPRVGSVTSGGTKVTYLGTSAGTVPVGTICYLFYIRQADGGQDVWVVSGGVASQVALTLNAGTPPGSWPAPPAGAVRIGTVSTVTNLLDGVVCRLAVWESALAATDIQQLAAIDPADEPVLVWARALTAPDVNEGATLADIPILDYIHPSTGFTAQVVNAGNRGTLTTDGTDLTYVAGSVSGDQTETAATWRISKDGVNSPTVGFTTTVLETGTPEELHPAINCYTDTPFTTVDIGSGSGSIGAALADAVLSAVPGTHIRIRPGTYTGGTVTLNGLGTEANPIVIKPRDGLGTVTISGGTWTLANGSERLVVSRLYFSGGRIVLLGEHNRVTRCRFRDMGATYIQIGSSATLNARLCRVDHCDFSGWPDPVPAGRNFINIRPDWGANHHHILIDYCYFHDTSSATTFNGQEAIGSFATTGGLGDDLDRGETVTIDHCLFQNLSMPGEDECVTIKSRGWVVKYSTFINLGGLDVTFRTTQDSELRSCWFESMDRPRIYGDNNLLIGNRFVGGLNLFISCGNATTAQVVAGTASLVSYARCFNNRVIGNRMTSGTITVGALAGAPPTVPTESALDNVLEANTRDAGGSAHAFPAGNTVNGFSPAQVNTIVSATTTESYTPAVKLTSADVGLTVADTFCPLGP